MDLKEIKQAVDAGKKVTFQTGYVVIKNKKDNDYYIKCINNNHMIGLTWTDNVTMNGKESDFKIAE